MDTDSRYEQLMTVLSTYSDDELHGALSFTKAYVSKHSSTTRASIRNIKTFRKILQENNVPSRCIERECIFRMGLLGLITKDEVHERIDAIDRACKN